MTSPEKTPRGVRPLLPVGNDPYRQLRVWEHWSEKVLGVRNPFHQTIEGTLGVRARIDGRDLISFSSYNYLGLSGDPEVSSAAKAAIDEYGTSVSASRVVAGERPLHGELERAIAEWIGTEDALAFVSGHATNVTTVGCLFGPKDLILYDILSHNSLQQGIRLSGARGLPFPHNNVRAAEVLLARERASHDRVLIVTEGVFSMDGDISPIPEFIALRNRYHAHLMIDEAHSLGVLGETGRGIVEHFSIAADSVDLWMGTFSKSLASCGGYIAGCRSMVDALRTSAPGFVYSCGMTPPNTAAALASLEKMRSQPERVGRLRARAERFRSAARSAGFDTGSAGGSGIVPVIFGNSVRTLLIAHRLFEQGILVHALFHPVVPERAARLRFFLSSEHSTEDIDWAVRELAEAQTYVDAGIAAAPSHLQSVLQQFDSASSV